MRKSQLTLAAAAALAAAPARAWIFPEHRDIGVAGVERLPAADRAALQSLWDGAWQGYPQKMCPQLSAGDQGVDPKCLDFATFPALAGDHSCSPKAILEKVLPSDWILGVSRVAAETKDALANSSSRLTKLNAIATSNLKFQVVDPEYATRAGANNAHFLLPRTTDDLRTYAETSLAEGAPLNAFGLYAQYHLAALAAAHRFATSPPPAAERAGREREILALEGFALHWLEDLYASGHIVGTWGSDAWRKGTHDYYNEFGFDTVDWKGRHLIAFGDSNMRPADLERASVAVATSLQQLVAALRPGDPLGTLAPQFGPGTATVFAFNSCQEMGQPSAKGPKMAGYFDEQVTRMPVPARGQGDVHVPRYRDELGPFIGAFGTISGGTAWGGTGSTGARALGGLAAGARIGFGADSLTGSIGTGIAFVEVAFASETAQLQACSGGEVCAALGTSALFPQMPARSGLRLGLHLPFWVVPGDVVLLAPVLFFASKPALSKVAVEAASGGLIPYERSFRTDAGIFQIVAGREVNVTFFGYGSSQVLRVMPIGTTATGAPQYGVVHAKSLELAFPVLEWTPFRTFATQLTFIASLQLGFSFELQVDAPVLYPTTGPGYASLGTPWQIFLRGQFDGRYFFGSREDLNPPR